MTANGPLSYIEPSQNAGRAFMQRGIKGEVVMLNLLRFRDIADYSANPELAPETPISGAQAYDLYIAHTLPYLKESGGDVLFMGNGGAFLIGPEDESWDKVLLIRQKSVDSFMAFATHKAYLDGLAHRTAAVKDTRLLPLVAQPPVNL